MNSTIEKLLKVAGAELGVKESPANSNNVKYNTWYYGKAVSGSGYAWCSVFVTWCFEKADILDLAFGTLADARKAIAENVGAWRKAGNGKQWITSDYRPGDVVMFDWDANSRGDHVGIVESVSGSTLTCLEGNTAVGNDSNGGEVMRRQRKLSQVIGAFRAAWPQEETPSLELKVGDIVTFAGSTQYNGPNYTTPDSTSVKPGPAKVTQLSPGGKHPIHVIKMAGQGSTVYGWVDAKDVQLIAPGESGDGTDALKAEIAALKEQIKKLEEEVAALQAEETRLRGIIDSASSTLATV